MRVWPVTLGLLCVFVSGSCGGSGSSSTASPTAPTAPDPTPVTVVIEIRGDRGNQSFSPNPARVEPGARVIWRNVDSEIHRVFLRNPDVDTGNILPGQSTAPLPLGGVSQPYFCSVHPGMVGRLNEAPEPPSSDDDECPYEGYC